MTMDKLFDGSDAHLLPDNAELIQRLRKGYGNMYLEAEAADALEAEDKRIAELERNYLDSVEVNTALQHGLYEKERKLDVARLALRDLCDWDGDLVLKDFCEDALAQIGGDDEQT